MGAYEMLKDVVSVAQKIDNLDLMRKLLELQTEIVALTDENRRLREQIATREDLQFRGNAYWRKSGEGPFCSKCWDVDARMVRAHASAMYKPQCPHCHTVIEKQDNLPPTAPPSGTPSPWL